MKAVNFRPVGSFSSVVAIATVLVGLALPISAPRAALADQGDCGQPASSGSDPHAIDCLFMLGVAVGTQECGPDPCICDTSADGEVSATDGLICLAVAVGLISQPACSCTGTTTTTVTTTTTTLVPGACGGAEAPACDGSCSANQACVSTTGGCFCRSFSCGSFVSGGGRCGGSCPSGSACVYTIEGCRCRSGYGPCESDSPPGCYGSCSAGSYCRSDSASGECRCESVACGDFAGSPTCLGVCPAGLACAESESGCECVPAS